MPDTLSHHYIRNTSLPYVPDASPIASEQPYFMGGSNVLTSLREFLQRRPGFATYEATPTTFTNTVRRIFTWRRWNSSFFVMMNEVGGGLSSVYKLKVGTDASFILIYTSVVAEPFDFVTANNQLFMGNGSEMVRWDGDTLRGNIWGIGISPMTRNITGATNATPIVITLTAHGYATGDKLEIQGVLGNTAANGTWTITNVSANTFSLDSSVGNGAYTSGGTIKGPAVGFSGTGYTATVGYRYVYTYGNSTTGHQSDVSDPSPLIKPTAQGIAVKGVYPIHADEIHIYRTTDGGDGIFFELVNSPLLRPVFTITNATNATPIVITTSTAHGFVTGDTVHIVQVEGNTAANGTWTITNLTATTFSLDTSVGNGAYTGFGLVGRAGVFTFIDSITDDVDLLSIVAPVPGMIDGPLNGFQPTFFANRIWYYKQNAVHYSAWEEQGDVGVEEESFPRSNVYRFESEVTGLSATEDCLIVFTANSIWRIEGDSLDTFTRTRVFVNMGLRERAAQAKLGKGCAFLDTADVIRVTNGFTQEEISLHIRGDLEGIDHTKASMGFHYDGRRNWLILMDQEDGVARIYDADLKQWLPPWTISARAIWSGEVSAGVVELFYGISTNKVVKMTPALYLDDGATFAAHVTTGLFDVCEKAATGEVGYLRYLALERNSVAPATVKYLTDEDPATGTFTTITEITDPPYRVQGTSLVEKWYQTQVGPAARRVSIRWDWAAASTNFKLYSIDVGHEVAAR
jgi:hypothetical protein